MRKTSPQRSVLNIAAIAVIFGIGGAIVFGGLDKAQTHTTDDLFDPSILSGHVGHFFGEAFRAITTGTYHDTPYRTFLLMGLGTTLEFCFLAMPIALLLGLMLALMSRSKNRILRVPARGYVEFFRDTPLLVQLFAIYWGLTFLGASLVNAFTAGLATLALNYAAYECENLRAGIEALDRGQSEAAAVLGLGGGKTLRLVVIPQIIPVVLPPVINDVIYLFKDSAIFALLTTSFFASLELTKQTDVLTRRAPSLSWQFYLWGGIAYLLISVPLARAARAVERRLKTTGFVPRFDLVTVATVVLVVMLVAGWVSGLAVAGLSGENVGKATLQLVFGLALTVSVLAVAMIIFVVVLYVPGTIVRAFRGTRPAPISGGVTQSISASK